MTTVLGIGLCAVICGAKHFTQMAAFGAAKKEWLARFLDLSNGIPSHDVFNAVFARLQPAAFEQALVAWVTGRSTAADTAVHMETAVRLLLRD